MAVTLVPAFRDDEEPQLSKFTYLLRGHWRMAKRNLLQIGSFFHYFTPIYEISQFLESGLPLVQLIGLITFTLVSY